MKEPEFPPLVYMGQPGLMQVQDPVPPAELETEAFQSGLALLADCMDYYHGIGIAAPQIGWGVRVFCMGIRDLSERYPGAELIPFEFWINPEIVQTSTATNWAWEGCLSVPGMRGWVERPQEVEVKGLDESGNPVQKHYSGFAARVWQHEYDHLDGILFPMRVTQPKWLVPQESLSRQRQWPAEWPSKGSRETQPGELSEEA